MSPRSRRWLWLIPALGVLALPVTDVIRSRETARVRKQFMDGVRQGDFSAVKAAILSGYQVRQWNKRDGLDDETPLSISVEKGNAQIVGFLVDSGISPNLKTRDGTFPLHDVALKGGRADVADALIKKGADVNAVHEGTGLAPLDVAVMNGNVELVRVLLKGGANTHGGPRSGKLSPIESAASDGNTDIVAMLIRAGAPSPLPYLTEDDRARHKAVQKAVCQAEGDPATRLLWGCTVRLPAEAASALEPLRGMFVTDPKATPSAKPH